MARTITLDGVQVTQARFIRDSTGNIHVFCEYQITASGAVIQIKQTEINQWLTPSQLSSASSILTALGQAIAGAEL